MGKRTMCTTTHLLSVDTKLPEDHHYVVLLANVCCKKFEIPIGVDLDTIPEWDCGKEIGFMMCLHDAKLVLSRIKNMEDAQR